jgi:hypothetical protein
MPWVYFRATEQLTESHSAGTLSVMNSTSPSIRRTSIALPLAGLMILAVSFLQSCGSDSPTSPDDLEILERKIEVLPIFFVPADETQPSGELADLLMQHLQVAQDRYEVLMKQRDTFEIRSGGVLTYQALNSLDFYRSQSDSAYGHYIVAELLDYLDTDRHHCNFILLVIVVNSVDQYPAGGGMPINGGFNTGGGYVEMSSYRLANGPAFQSTLQHELGHAFGLPHSSSYGFSMDDHISIMSYNTGHWWTGLTPPANQGVLAPEDLRGLSYNRMVFGDFYFDPAQDIPDGYNMPGTIFILVTHVDLPDQPEYVVNATSSSGSTDDTLPGNAVNRSIWPQNTFNAETMWVSGEAGSNGLVPLEVEFPQSETIDRISIHSRHQNTLNPIEEITIEVWQNGQYLQVSRESVDSADETFTFTSSSSSRWRFSFKAGTSQKVTIRGIQMYDGNVQLYPPLFPYTPPS